MKKHNAVSSHDVKLAVINNPGVKPVAIAGMLGIDASEVYKARVELNIPCKRKSYGAMLFELVEKRGQIKKSEAAKELGFTLRQVQSAASNLRRFGHPVGIKRLSKHESMYSIDENFEEYKPNYVAIYEKMATDTPREEWSSCELMELFGMTSDALRQAIRRIRQKKSPVETRVQYGSKRIAYYRLGDLDGKKE